MDAIGQYELRERLGSGAFATVWLGYDAGFDGLVAIKVLGDNWVGQPDIVRRFVEEARLLWRSEDRRVIDVYTLGELPSGQPWFAMEFADRGTLQARQAAGFGSLDDEIALITEMGRCVEAIHRLGAVHRDVKPGNFLIKSVQHSDAPPIPGLAPDERLKIADLGLAKVVAEASGFTIAAGSPLYMAPEQASTSANVTFAADVYSLGICAWEILTHSTPSMGERISLANMSLRARRPEIPVAVEEAVLRAIAHEPADRWSSVPEFVDALNTTPARTVMTPPPVPTVQQSPQPPRRRPLLVGAALVVAVLVASVALALVTRGSTTGVADAPTWFELPETVEVDTVEVKRADDVLSLVGPMPSGFIASCNDFIDAANAAGYATVRDECDGGEALAAARHSSGASAVIAQLSNGRVGWRFGPER